MASQSFEIPITLLSPRFRSLANDRNHTGSIRGDKIPGMLLSTITFYLLFVAFKKINKKTNQFLRQKSHIEKFSGPRTYPIVGNVHEMLEIASDFYGRTTSMCKEWGDPLRVWKFNHPILFVSTYNIANQLLRNPNFNAKTLDLDMIRRLPGGKGLSTNPPHIAAARRKLLQSGFTKSVVENQVYIFGEESKKLVKQLQKFADSGEQFNLQDHVMLCAFRMACRSSFGDGFMANRSDAEAKEHLDALHIFAEHMGNRIMSPNVFKKSDFIFYNFTSDGKETMKCVKIVNKFAREAISTRRKERMARADCNKITNTENTIQSGKGKVEYQPYLDLLLDLEKDCVHSEDDMIGELNNYLAGAYDTIALTVQWMLFALSLDPTCQEKVLEELSRVLGSETTVEDTSITALDTRDLKYLECCVKESLRVYPTAPFFPRSCHTDVQLDDGRIVPAGTDVLILVNLINRQEEYFPEPDTFKPERHVKQIRQFMPFSIGGRNCLGQILAMYMIKVISAFLLKEFKWETMDKPENIKFVFQALLYPTNGIQFKIQKRHKSAK